MNDVVKIDASLAAMQFMLVARAHGYETNPIGGFEEKASRLRQRTLCSCHDPFSRKSQRIRL